jgi:hypothetical protein
MSHENSFETIDDGALVEVAGGTGGCGAGGTCGGRPGGGQRMRSRSHEGGAAYAMPGSSSKAERLSALPGVASPQGAAQGAQRDELAMSSADQAGGTVDP